MKWKISKTKYILNRLKHQIWCDLVIGRSDNNKVQWNDKIIRKYINHVNKYNGKRRFK